MKRTLVAIAILTLVIVAACSKSESTTASIPPAPGGTPESTPPPTTQTAETPADDAAETSTVQSDSPTEAEIANAPRLSPQEAWELVQSGEAVIVDIRSKDEWDNERIAGSLSIPLWEVSKRARAELEPTRWIIPYCT